MQGVDLNIFIPLLLIKQVETFRDTYSLTRVLAWKFGLISIADIISRLKELDLISASGSGNEFYEITLKGLSYLETNYDEAKRLMLEKYKNELSFIESVFGNG